MSLPFLAKKPIDLPPIISVELIQITDKTNIPFAPKAKKIIEKVKEKEKKLVSEQAPPKKIKKQKPDAVPLPDEKIEKVPVKVKVLSCLGSQPICSTRFPILEKAAERFDEVVDLPMPPLP